MDSCRTSFSSIMVTRC